MEQLAAEVERLVSPPPSRADGLEIGGSPSMGPEDAPVTIIEFADFECAFCASAVPTLDRVLAAYPGQVRIVFKHNPMPFHKQAVLAHKAALAAAEAGKFWDMHRLLYDRQEHLELEGLRENARVLGLDLDRFDAYLASDEGLHAIQADRALAKRLGLPGVPAFFINGRLVAGVQPFEAFQQVIDEEIEIMETERVKNARENGRSAAR